MLLRILHESILISGGRVQAPSGRRRLPEGQTGGRGEDEGVGQARAAARRRLFRRRGSRTDRVGAIRRTRLSNAGKARRGPGALHVHMTRLQKAGNLRRPPLPTLDGIIVGLAGP